MKNRMLLLSSLLATGLSYTNISNAADSPKSVVTSFYPLAFMAEQIAGDKANVINLAGSIDIHNYAPTPRDLVKLNKADLVVFQGAELEQWTDGVIPELKAKGITTLEVTHNLELAKLEEHDDHSDDHDDHKDEHKDHHKDEHDDHKDEHKEHHKGEHDDHKEEHKDHHKDEHDDHKDEHKDHHKDEHDDHKKESGGHDEHHHGEFDAHTWLDPILAQQMVDEISQALVKIDPANESMYKANAKKLKARYAMLHLAFEKGLSQCSNDELIISHDAYGYLAKRYGFKAHTIAGFSPHDEPSAKILAELKKEAEEGITHILIEENNIRRFADTLAKETGLATLTANPLGRGTLDPKKDFFDIMEENLSNFKTALNCKI